MPKVDSQAESCEFEPRRPLHFSSVVLKRNFQELEEFLENVPELLSILAAVDVTFRGSTKMSPPRSIWQTELCLRGNVE